MMKRIAALALLGSLACAGFALPVQAGQDVPAGLARQIDAQAAEFTASDAKLRRMEIIRRTMERDRYQRGRGPGYGAPAYGRYRGYDGPRRGYYGPRPGYGGPRPGYYGQGVHPGTGYPPGYYGR